MTAWQMSPEQVQYAIDCTEKLRNIPHDPWEDARRRLAAAGIAPEDAALPFWVSAGPHTLGGATVSRDERVFSFDATFGFGRDGRELPPGHGWVGQWKAVPAERIRSTDAGFPNSWLQAVLVAREVFAREAAGG